MSTNRKAPFADSGRPIRIVGRKQAIEFRSSVKPDLR
jgi:hypothetical protein